MFKEHILFRLGQIGRSIWLRPVLYALGAILAIVLGPTLDLVVPQQMHSVLQDDAVANVLTLLASPMLAVAIFSLGTMVSAFQISSDAATPRARPLVSEDRTAQNAISTFLGAFLFAILGIIGISAGLFSDGGRLILFVLSILLIVLVIATFISWMNRLTNLGGVTEIIDQVEHEAMRGFRHLAAQPWLGGKAAGNRPKNAKPLTIGKYGHIQHIDIEALNAIAEQIGEDIFLAVRPGVFVHPGEPVLFTVKTPDDKTTRQLRKAFIIGGQRAGSAPSAPTRSTGSSYFLKSHRGLCHRRSTIPARQSTSSKRRRRCSEPGGANARNASRRPVSPVYGSPISISMGCSMRLLPTSSGTGPGTTGSCSA